ncbi:MAG: hypothetical protein ACRENG_37155 [bacterium]
MFPKNPSRCRLIGIGGAAILLCSFAPPVGSVQVQEAFYVSTKIPAEASERKKESASAAEMSPRKNFPSNNKTKRAPLSPARKLEANKITSLFVRTNDSNRIQLSILITYKDEFTLAVRELVGEKVTPLLFSVSTLPNRTVHFDPALLRFEQRGRSWQPSPERNAIDIWPWEEGGPFGGTLTDAQVQQGVILLPEWFDPQAPITLRYGDFHYLARFIEH